MSFGFSVGDLIAVTKLCWNVVENARQACGVHDELTQEVSILHKILKRLQHEAETPESLINRQDDGRREELHTILGGCNRTLKVLQQVLYKYNNLSIEKRSTAKLWQKIRFGNGEVKDLARIKQDLATYTSAMTIFLNLLAVGSQGRVEEHMEAHGEELRELRQAVNWITASLQSSNRHREGSILTSYAEDDKAIWKEFRRELIKEGFSSSYLSRHKSIIKDYVLELGARGALDDPISEQDSTTDDEKSDESANDGDRLQPNSPCPSTPETHSNAAVHEDIAPPWVNRTYSEGVPKIEEPSSVEYHSPTSKTPSVQDPDGIKEDLFAVHSPIPLNNTFSTDTIQSSLDTIAQPNLAATRAPQVAFVEEVLDEDFMPGAHPNCGPTIGEPHGKKTPDMPVFDRIDKEKKSEEALPSLRIPPREVSSTNQQHKHQCPSVVTSVDSGNLSMSDDDNNLSMSDDDDNLSMSDNDDKPDSSYRSPNWIIPLRQISRITYQTHVIDAFGFDPRDMKNVHRSRLPSSNSMHNQFNPVRQPRRRHISRQRKPKKVRFKIPKYESTISTSSDSMEESPYIYNSHNRQRTDSTTAVFNGG